MAFELRSRVRETSTTTGTGAYTLAGAVSSYEAFSTAFDNADTLFYVATMGADWEVGYGTFTAAGTTLARTTIIASSNADAAVNWGVGTKDISVTLPGFTDLDATNKTRLVDAIFGLSPVNDDVLQRKSGNWASRTLAQYLADLGALGKFPFPATQVASAGVNDLDDYEEGMFTPALAFGGASVGITYDVQTGLYTKIGRVVFYLISIDLSSNGSSTGSATITGFPFTSAGVQSPAAFAYYFGMASLVDGLGGLLSGTSMSLVTGSATTITSISDANITDTGGFLVAGLYFTTT